MRISLTVTILALSLLALLMALVLAGNAHADGVPHGPIYIAGDADFTAANGVTSGDGTLGDPYIIEGYTIEDPPVYGIHILNTTSAFIIRNVTIVCSAGRDPDGIQLINVTNGRAFNLTLARLDVAISLQRSKDVIMDGAHIEDVRDGVWMDLCSSTTIRNFTVTKCNNGIYLHCCIGCTVRGCRVRGSGNSGICLDGASSQATSNIVIESCEVADSEQSAMLLWCTTACAIKGCSVSNSSSEDLLLISAQGTVLSETRLGKKGLVIEGDYTSLDVQDTNTVDGRPLRFLKSESDLEIDPDTGQLFLVGCRGIKADGLRFDGVRRPIVLYESVGCSITNATLSNALEGIWVIGGGSHVIESVVIQKGLNPLYWADGMYIHFGNVSIRNCTIVGFLIGIDINGRGNVSISGTSVRDCLEGGIFGGAFPDAYIDKGGNLTVDGCSLLNEPIGLWSNGWNMSVRDTTFVNLSIYGISANYGTMLAIEDCEFTTCQEIAICVGAFFPTQVYVARNHVSGPAYAGIYGGTSQVEPASFELWDNNITGCQNGIYLHDGRGCSIWNNTVSGGISNDSVGLYIRDIPFTNISGCVVSDCRWGIMLNDSNFDRIERCTISGCEIGIRLIRSEATITNCTLRDCRYFGIALEKAHGTIIYHNSFMYNNFNEETDLYDGPQAYDDFSGPGWWDNGTEGNYWSDYRLRYPDAKVVGRFWDTPYGINGSAGKTDRYPLAFREESDPPVAEAGSDRTVGEGADLTFDGTLSSDESPIVSFSWSFVYGDRTIGLTGPVTGFTFDSIGTYEVTLTVEDCWGNSGSDTMLVHVVDLEPPVAKAGPDMLVDVGQRVVLDGGLSHDRHGIATYSWKVVDGGPGLVFATARATLSIALVGDYEAVLNVTDPSGNWATDTLIIKVRDLSPPVADAGPDIKVGMLEPVTLNGSLSTDNVGITTYAWEFMLGSGMVTLTGPVAVQKFDLPGIYIVTLTVADVAGGTASDTVTVEVRDTEPPLAVAGGNRTAVEGTYVTLDASASRDNVGVALYRWAIATANGTIYHSGAVFTFKVEGTHDLEVELRVEDATGNVAIDDLIVTVLPLWVTFTLGPFLDQDGHAVGGANVTVTLNGTAHSDLTDRLGWMEVTVVRYDLVSPAGVRATKEGYERLQATVPLDGLGRPSGDLPAMNRLPTLGLRSPLLLLLVAIIVVVLCGVGLVIYRRSKQKRGRPGT